MITNKNLTKMRSEYYSKTKCNPRKNHIVYCMDAFELLKQLPDKSVDLVLIDPPYNIGKDG